MIKCYLLAFREKVKIYYPRILYSTNFLLLCENAKKNPNKQDCKRIVTTWFSQIMKKKRLFSKTFVRPLKDESNAKKGGNNIIINSACYVLGTLLDIYINLFNYSCANQWDVATIIIPHFQWESWGIKKFTFLLKTIHPIKGEARIWTPVFWASNFALLTLTLCCL